jgi:hypothetical protein
MPRGSRAVNRTASLSPRSRTFLTVVQRDSVTRRWNQITRDACPGSACIVTWKRPSLAFRTLNPSVGATWASGSSALVTPRQRAE